MISNMKIKDINKINSIAIVVILLVMLIVTLCSCKTKYVPVKETHVSKEILIDTVVNVVLVPYKDSIATKDTSNYIENKYAYSWAGWSNGMLFHSLAIKDVDIPVNIQYKDKIYSSIIPVPYPVVKEKQLSWWQKLKMNVGGFGIGLMILSLIYIAFKIYRKIRPI